MGPYQSGSWGGYGNYGGKGARSSRVQLRVMWAESGRASVAAIAVLQTWLLVLHFYLVKPAMPCPGNLPFHDWLIQAGNAAAVFFSKMMRCPPSEMWSLT